MWQNLAMGITGQNHFRVILRYSKVRWKLRKQYITNGFNVHFAHPVTVICNQDAF